MKNINIENHLEAFVVELHKSIGHELREKAMELNLTFSQMEVLRYVTKDKNPTMKDIANYLDITPPSVTVIIEFLAKKGLIKRKVDKNDRRIMRIMITSKVSKILNSLKNRKLEIFKKIFLQLNNEDRKEFVRILTILNKGWNYKKHNSTK